MTTSFTASWHHTLIAGAVLALSACGGGSDNEPTPTPPTPTPTPPTTAELVQKFVTADDAQLYASAQFYRYQEVERFLEEHFKNQAAVAQRVAQEKKP